MNKQRQIDPMNLLTYFVNNHHYQVVTFTGTMKLRGHDLWLVNPDKLYPVICLSTDSMSRFTIMNGPYRYVFDAIMSNFNKNGSLLVISLNQSSEDFVTDNISCVKIYPQCTLPTILSSEFNDLQLVIDHSEVNEKETKKLTKILKKSARSNLMQALKEEKSLPKNSMIVAGICIIVYLLSLLLTLKTKDSVVSSILLGSYYKMSVISAYEYWRLFTAGFVHIDIFHIVVNIMSLMNIGIVLEPYISRKQYWLILLASIFTGNLFELIVSENMVGLGVSGGIFGLLGAYIVILYVHGAFKNQKVLMNFVHILVINFLISMMPGISFLAHLGGLIAGCMLMIFFNQAKRLRTMKTHALAGWVLLVVLCLGMIPRVQYITPIYGLTDTRIIQTVYDFNLDFYGDYLMDKFCEKIDGQNEPTYRIYLESNVKK